MLLSLEMSLKQPIQFIFPFVIPNSKKKALMEMEVLTKPFKKLTQTQTI